MTAPVVGRMAVFVGAGGAEFVARVEDVDEEGWARIRSCDGEHHLPPAAWSESFVRYVGGMRCGPLRGFRQGYMNAEESRWLYWRCSRYRWVPYWIYRIFVRREKS